MAIPAERRRVASSRAWGRKAGSAVTTKTSQRRWRWSQALSWTAAWGLSSMRWRRTTSPMAKPVAGRSARPLEMVVRRVSVAPAAGDGAELGLLGEDLEDGARVVGEAADDGEVGFNEAAEAADVEVGEDLLEVFGGVVGTGDEVPDVGDGEAEGFEGGVELVLGIAFEFVEDAEEGLDLGFAQAALVAEALPGAAVGKAHGEVFRAEAEGGEGGDGEGNEFGVGGGGGVSDEVGVELDELAEAAFLGLLVAGSRSRPGTT